ncbi:SDR family NAD(P)-dependent oxidoreductase [Actinosynnema sp. NPDC004786]
MNIEQKWGIMEFDGQVALVTGSTAGIGREVARLPARGGARVVVTGRDAARGAGTVASIEAEGGRARAARRPNPLLTACPTFASPVSYVRNTRVERSERGRANLNVELGVRERRTRATRT